MIVSVFVRRLKEGATFEDFLREWEADVGFGLPTRVFNAVSLTDPRDVFTQEPTPIEIGSAQSLLQLLAGGTGPST